MHLIYRSHYFTLSIPKINYTHEPNLAGSSFPCPAVAVDIAGTVAVVAIHGVQASCFIVESI